MVLQPLNMHAAYPHTSSRTHNDIVSKTTVDDIIEWAMLHPWESLTISIASSSHSFIDLEYIYLKGKVLFACTYTSELIILIKAYDLLVKAPCLH